MINNDQNQKQHQQQGEAKMKTAKTAILAVAVLMTASTAFAATAIENGSDRAATAIENNGTDYVMIVNEVTEENALQCEKDSHCLTLQTRKEFIQRIQKEYIQKDYIQNGTKE